MALNRLSLAATTALSIAASLPGAVAPAATAPESCSWRIAARVLYQEVSVETGARAESLKEQLENSGVDSSDFVPADCNASSTDESSAVDSNDTGGSSSPQTGEQGTTAGETFQWGEPDQIDDFDGDLSGWNLYDGPGHGGNGTRSPDAASVADGILTIDGTGDGTTAGMAWSEHSQQYGRWEVRMRAPKGSPSYNALALLWPTAENFPVGGEVDFVEIMDPDRKKVELFLHYGEDNSQVHGEVEVDATEWHNYAVEWTPDSITAFVDGEEWWKTTDMGILPPGPMHLTLQLDWFPKGDSETGQVQYDWVKQWSLGENEEASTQSSGSEGSTDSDSSTTATDEENNWNGQGGSESGGE
ncbi:hypothetical protein Ae168Ps1_6359 [Pseudonocardia sp. Ae168_Ps1]|uniref:glycoside hydrolase family 16 protein n=1 Tax=unclassified Pseudonocardia TaxID=2619320 RepID=UPI00094B0B73|nr:MULTISPECIES: glycoside hydrolase family 16 protein [unclassified Pseudonocardia]OLL69898.1 hypothetical protein Ae150APs1_6208c [Pseudonocardia sp. Ae150A_Ps1]OLL70122.1 hypothetical protein Ae168Ps1_6359 [Pseudonocardia sp. Ae168_Ps1]OLL70393.1 hypothetical protein Ae263Ps1_6337 [Pseudonocardia sp. Ae263_Ps1]OLL89174.1 hypothetical protein Ae356Ps1_6202 [Pseudonocardia sp. Ae356_Ps1]